MGELVGLEEAEGLGVALEVGAAEALGDAPFLKPVSILMSTPLRVEEVETFTSLYMVSNLASISFFMLSGTLFANVTVVSVSF